ncbi:MAG TPA: C4-dicarboxylate ABC transporter [Clostridiales bacterium]|nr:C4-dicarboxylate ABC transporter [Clostridiales bacterium]
MTSGLDDQMQADLDEVMRKYDRESNTRVWEGWQRWVVGILMVAFSLYCIGMTLFFSGLPETRLAAFLAMIVFIGFLTYPVKKGHVKVNSMPWYDIVLMLVGAGCFLYFAFNALPIIKLATRIQTHHVIIGAIGILVLIELCRRCVGVPILCVLGALLVYTFYNQLSYNPSLYQALKNVVYKLFYTTNGVIGTPINVCYTYIVLFIIFGAFLERTGIANFFIAFANRLAGWSAGGPAKVAVISSALCGMVSGSSVGNTVTTGSVTIPMMKKTGYHPDFAGAVEAAASTGGQIMPPIMGAAAFLMAEYMDLPYATVAVKAILPAVLYFTGIFIAVHLEAKKLGLKGLSKDEMPKWADLGKKIYLLAPLVLLVWLVSSGAKTMQFSAAVSILAAVIVGFLNKDERLTFKKIFEALEAGAKGAITVAVACAIAGMIAGCITVTGLASILINTIVQLAGSATFIGLILTMVCCIVLGMGVPTTANYCIMASTCAPILIKMGFPLVAAHFFVFYFGIVADITPPVALAAYAGSAIAKGNPMKTGINATKLAIAAFIVPYIFAYSPAMLFVNVTSVWEVIQIVLSALLGIFGVAAGLEGFVLRKMNWLYRIVCLVGGLGLMIPGAISDLVGLVLIGGVFVIQYLQNKKEREIA